MKKKLNYLMVVSLSILFVLTAASCGSFEQKTLIENNQPPARANINSGTADKIAPPEASDTVQEKVAVFEGAYENRVFGYKVEIPRGLKGISSPPPMPQHGFVIKLSEDNEASLSVDGSYNSLFWESLDDAYQAEFNDAAKKAEFKQLEEKKALLLDKQKAIGFTFRYRDAESGKIKIADKIIGFRKCAGEEVEIVYTVALETPETRFETDKTIMRQILSSWRTLASCGR